MRKCHSASYSAKSLEKSPDVLSSTICVASMSEDGNEDVTDFCPSSVRPP